MPERLEDLLRQASIDPMPASLPSRIRQRLAAARKAERRRRWLLDAWLAAVLLGGLFILSPQLAPIGAQPPPTSALAAEVWLAHAERAPAQTVFETLTGAVEWAGRLTDSLGIAGLLGVILLAVPLFAWLRRLMPEVEEGAMA